MRARTIRSASSRNSPYPSLASHSASCAASPGEVVSPLVSRVQSCEMKPDSLTLVRTVSR